MTANRVAVHKDPVWRGRADFLISVDLDPSGTEVEAEQLWARKIDPRHFELCCVPFFTYHLALGDIVETDGDFRVLRVTQASGRRVFRVWFAGGTADRDEVREKLVALGGLTEWSSKNLLAADVASSYDAERMAGYLAELAERGQVMFEHGKTR